MKNAEAVQIIQAGNGYQVFPGYDPSTMMSAPRSNKDVLVFRSLAELTDWLAVHFTYRGHGIKSDAVPKK